jgi:hypothetical protein
MTGAFGRAAARRLINVQLWPRDDGAVYEAPCMTYAPRPYAAAGIAVGALTSDLIGGLIGSSIDMQEAAAASRGYAPPALPHYSRSGLSAC